MIAVLMTVLCLMIVNIKEPEQTEEEQPETTHAEEMCIRDRSIHT